MEIDQKTIEGVANLANLSLSKEEKKEMETQLKDILDYMDLLNELDLGGIEPTAHTLGYTNVARKDTVRESFNVGVVQGIAPEWEDGHVVVPRVV